VNRVSWLINKSSFPDHRTESAVVEAKKGGIFFRKGLSVLKCEIDFSFYRSESLLFDTRVEQPGGVNNCLEKGVVVAWRLDFEVARGSRMYL